LPLLNFPPFSPAFCAERGIELRVNDTAAAFLGGSHVEAVATSAGDIVPCDLVIAAIGVKPDLGFLHDSGVQLGTASWSTNIWKRARRESSQRATSRTSSTLFSGAAPNRALG